MYKQIRDHQSSPQGATARRPREPYALDFIWEFNSLSEGEGRAQRRSRLAETGASELDKALAFAG
jgi:hypothetical protein